MTIELTRAQLHAFLALILGIVVVSLAPVIVTGLVGVLGTLVGVMWQSRPRGHEPSGTPGDPVSVTETETAR